MELAAAHEPASDSNTDCCEPATRQMSKACPAHGPWPLSCDTMRTETSAGASPLRHCCADGNQRLSSNNSAQMEVSACPQTLLTDGSQHTPSGREPLIRDRPLCSSWLLASRVHYPLTALLRVARPLGAAALAVSGRDEGCDRGIGEGRFDETDELLIGATLANCHAQLRVQIWPAAPVANQQPGLPRGRKGSPDESWGRVG